EAKETEIGYLPYPEDINLQDAEVSLKTLQQLLSVDLELWKEETANIRDFYQKFNGKVPPELMEELDGLEQRLSK
ncbi:MAG: phosphoenolpyruvate carboxykinase, partial [Evtepia sp.]|nr:phosphoenolpyruvate carboxykinase [Evtepia sp.]